MRLKAMDLGARVAVSLFAMTMLFALLYGELLVYTSLGGDVGIEAVKTKYADSFIISAMRGSMYEHVTEDASIEAVERWIAEGATEEGYEATVRDIMEEDCTNCHAKDSTMTDANPALPLTSYEDVVKVTRRGLPALKLLRELHVHAFALGTILMIIGLLLSAADIKPWLKVALPVIGFLALWVDTWGWILGTVGSWAAWLIVGGGGTLAASVGVMSGILLLDCWVRVPIIGRKPPQ